MPSFDPRERTQASRIAAHSSWANTADRSARTAPGRAALQARFEAEVDPDGVLEPAERAKRADSARRAHFAKMALRSSRSRRKAAEARRAADAELAGGGDAA